MPVTTIRRECMDAMKTESAEPYLEEKIGGKKRESST
jgi:hypothetical protein